MERLSIDEVIAHCNRRVESFERFSSRQECENWSIDSPCTKEYWEHRQVAEWLKQLKSYKDAEEQGLLLRLPVAIGSTIYHFEYPTRIDDKGIEWSILDKKRVTIKPMKFALCHLNGIGRLYFLTKEEAEQALKQKGE